jgi:hypothetical protein
VLREDVDALLLHVELDAVDGPRLLKSKQLTVEVGVTHTPTVALSRDRSAFTRPRRRPTRFPDAPKKAGALANLDILADAYVKYELDRKLTVESYTEDGTLHTARNHQEMVRLTAQLRGRL